MARNHEALLIFLQGLFFNPIVFSRALVKAILENHHSAVLSVEPYSMEARSERERSARFGQRPYGLSIRFDSNNEQHRRKGGQPVGVTLAAKTGLFNFDSDFSTNLGTAYIA